MKTLLLVAGVLFTANSFAQTNAIKLNKGQTITVTSSVTQNMDMGMGMTMNSSSNSTHLLKVNDETGNNYNISTTLTKLKVNSSSMGQDSKYDSENVAGSDTEVAAMFDKSMNVAENSLLDKKTGIAVAVKDEGAEEGEDEDNFLKGMMGGTAGKDGSSIINSSFFTQAAGKKVGDKWIDTTSVGGFKNLTNYTVASINGDMMVVNVDGTLSGNKQVETQGMQIDVNMNTKNKGTIELNKKTLMVTKRKVDAEIASTMDMMGQSMEMTGVITTVTEYK